MRFSAKLEVLLGILTILTGFLYAFELFGPTEPIVATWGSLAVIIGVGIVFLGINKHNIAKFIEMVIVFFLVIIQTPPIFLWIAFNGRGISDGTPASNFVAHWIFGTPHILIALMGLVIIVSLFKRSTD